MMRPWLIGLLVAATILLALVPVFGSAVLIQFGINALIFATLAQAWNIIGGFTGYVSFGNSVFYGLGTYGTAIAMAQFGLPFWAGLALGAVLGVLCALLVGLPDPAPAGTLFRHRDAGPVARDGGDRLQPRDRRRQYRPHPAADPRRRHVLRAVAGAARRLRRSASAWISRSRFGMGLIAIREDEDAAASMGVNTTLYKSAALDAVRALHQRSPAASMPIGSPSSIRRAPSTRPSTCAW